MSWLSRFTTLVLVTLASVCAGASAPVRAWDTETAHRGLAAAIEIAATEIGSITLRRFKEKLVLGGKSSSSSPVQAFGELDAPASTITTDNRFLFAGEQLDPNSGFYYLRARYMNPANGRFTQMDSFDGFMKDPVSIHKYTYGNNNPSNYTDPSGNFSIVEAGAVNNIIGRLTEFNIGSGLDLGSKLADPNSDSPSFEGWSAVVSMVPFGAAAKWLTRGLKEVKYGAGVVRYSMKHPPREKEIVAAAFIAEKHGATIFLRGNNVKGADALINGVKWEIKTLDAGTNNAVSNNIRKAVEKQSSRVVIDGRAVGLTEAELYEGIARAARNNCVASELIVLMPGGRIIQL